MMAVAEVSAILFSSHFFFEVKPLMSCSLHDLVFLHHSPGSCVWLVLLKILLLCIPVLETFRLLICPNKMQLLLMSVMI